MTELLDIAPSGPVLGAAAYAWRGAAPQTGRRDYLSASVSTGWWNTLAGQGQTRFERDQADDGRDAYLTEREWRQSDEFREGLRYEPGMSRARARFNAAVYDQNRVREDVMARRDAGIIDSVLGFGAMMLGGLPTPENFIPFVGPAWRAAQILRYGTIGGRVAAGAADAAIGTALASPIVLGSQREFGDDVGLADALLDIAVGAAIGGVLGAGSGLAARWTGRDQTLFAAQRTYAAAADQLDQGAAAIAEGRAPAVSPDLMRELEALRGRVAEADEARLAAQADADVARRAANAAGRLADVGPGVEVEVRSGADSAITFRVRYEVVDARTLITSHQDETFAPDPRFDQRLQVRDRDRDASVQAVRDRASRLDPAQLLGSPLGSTGAPIVGPTGMVESGNGRVLSARLAYREGMAGAAAYRAEIERLGFDTTGMDQPMVTRRRITELDDDTLVRATDDANRDTIERRSLTEEARADARLLTPDVVGRLRLDGPDADADAAFARAFVQALPAPERNAMIQDGRLLSAEGQRRLDRAVQAAAFDDRRLVATLLESTDENLARLGRVLGAAARDVMLWRNAVAEGRILAQLDGTHDLIAAALMIRDARAKGRPLTALLDLPGDLLGSGPTAATRMWLSLMLDRRSNGTAAVVAADELASRVRRALTIAAAAPQAPDMFGTAPPTIRNVLATLHMERAVDLPYLPDAIRDFADPAPPSLRGPPAEMPEDAVPPRQAAEAPADTVTAIGNLPPAEQRAALQQFRSLQADWTVDRLYQSAEANQAALNRAVAEIAVEHSAAGKQATPKVRATAEAKIARKGYINAGQLTDIVRAGFTAPTPQAADSMVAALARRFAVLDEGWSFTDAGYFDRKVLVRFSDGMVGEVQMWPPGLLEAKEQGGGYALYERARRLDVSVAEQAAERQALDAEARALYSAAIREAGADWAAFAEGAGSGGNSASQSAARGAGTTRPVQVTSVASTGTQGPPGSSTATASVGDSSTAARPSQLVTTGNRDIDPSSVETSSIAHSGSADPQLDLLAAAVEDLARAGRLDEADALTLRQGNQAADTAIAMADALQTAAACMIRAVT